MIKLLRETERMKAETLAELSRLTLRSIERAESGRHLPSEQSLAQIAKAFEVTITIFDPVDDEVFRKQIEEAAKKTVMVVTTPLENPAAVMAFVGDGQACQHDLASVEGDDALDAAAALVENFMDISDGWDELPLGLRLDLARDLVGRARELLALGYKTQMGSYRARHLGAKNLEFKVKLLTFLPKDHPGKYALVTLPAELETLPEDRITLPPRSGVAPAGSCAKGGKPDHATAKPSRA
jgi:transcriptional regulator with XRE-family HTH domain